MNSTNKSDERALQKAELVWVRDMLADFHADTEVSRLALQMLTTEERQLVDRPIEAFCALADLNRLEPIYFRFMNDAGRI